MTNTMVKAHIKASDAQSYSQPTTGPEATKDPFPTEPGKDQFSTWKKNLQIQETVTFSLLLTTLKTSQTQ